MFAEFALAAGLDVDPQSILSAEPPEPDVAFKIRGERHYAELVEITDQQLAQKHMISVKEHKITGGFFSQTKPLIRAFESKRGKSYVTSGVPLMLLAYYDKQESADEVEPDLISNSIGGIAEGMVASGVWQRVWIYTRWRQKVIWAYPAS